MQAEAEDRDEYGNIWRNESWVAADPAAQDDEGADDDEAVRC